MMRAPLRRACVLEPVPGDIFVHAVKQVFQPVDIFGWNAGKHFLFVFLCDLRQLCEQRRGRVRYVDGVRAPVIISFAPFQQAIRAQAVDQPAGRGFGHFQNLGDHPLRGAGCAGNNRNHRPLRPGYIEADDFAIELATQHASKNRDLECNIAFVIASVADLNSPVPKVPVVLNAGDAKLHVPMRRYPSIGPAIFSRAERLMRLGSGA